MINHRRHHASEAQIETHLDGDQDHGKDDSDESGHKSKPIVKQVASCKSEDQRHEG
jgi:hypothetical protein